LSDYIIASELEKCLQTLENNINLYAFLPSIMAIFTVYVLCFCLIGIIHTVTHHVTIVLTRHDKLTPVVCDKALSFWPFINISLLSKGHILYTGNKNKFCPITSYDCLSRSPKGKRSLISNVETWSKTFCLYNIHYLTKEKYLLTWHIHFLFLFLILMLSV
jgi:hypothetical protein